MSEQQEDKMSLKNHPVIQRVISKMRIGKVVATRSVKGRAGDHYVGFSGAWDSVQDDAGGATTLLSTQDAHDALIAESTCGMTLKEAKIAGIILGMTADRTAHQNAWAGGNISRDHLLDALKGINTAYGKLLADTLTEAEKAEPNSAASR